MKSKQKPSGEIPIILFERQKKWSAWLEKNHAASSGIWVRLAKKDSGLTSITYAEALDVALCYGWIDGQKQRYDEQSWLQKFTPRGAKSTWSKINREKALRLIESGQMRPPGLQAIESARQDGRWDAAYDSQSKATVPDDLQAELDRHPKAKSFFAALDRVNRFAIIFRVQTATKPETRVKRIQQFIQMLERNEKIHS